MFYTFLRFLTLQIYTFLRFFASVLLKNHREFDYFKSNSCTIWLFGAFLFGHMALFRLVIWRFFVRLFVTNQTNGDPMLSQRRVPLQIASFKLIG